MDGIPLYSAKTLKLIYFSYSTLLIAPCYTLHYQPPISVLCPFLTDLFFLRNQSLPQPNCTTYFSSSVEFLSPFPLSLCPFPSRPIPLSSSIFPSSLHFLQLYQPGSLFFPKEIKLLCFNVNGFWRRPLTARRRCLMLSGQAVDGGGSHRALDLMGLSRDRVMIC